MTTTKTANRECRNCEHAKIHPARLFSCECGTEFTAPVQKDTATCLSCLKPANFVAEVCKGCHQPIERQK